MYICVSSFDSPPCLCYTCYGRTLPYVDFSLWSTKQEMTFICLCIFHLDTLFSDWSTSPSLILLPSYYGLASFGLTKRFLSRLFIVNNFFIVMTSCPIPALFKYVQKIVIIFINVIVYVLSVLVSNCRMKLSINVNIQIMYTYAVFCGSKFSTC